MPIPNDRNFRIAVVGALSTLLYAYNWEQSGSLTPAMAAEMMADALDAALITCPEEVIPVIVNAYRTTSLAIGQNVWTKVTGLTTVPYDTGQWDSGNDQVVIDADGLYLVQLFGKAPTASQAAFALYLNGAPLHGMDTYANGLTNAFIVPSFFVPLSADDILTMWAWRLSGANIDPDLGGRLGLLVYRIGDLA
jgi:hypothetical protein